MKPDAFKILKAYRVRTGQLASDDRFGNNGAFMVPYKRETLAVIVSDQDGWDHVSVSLKERCPSWGEMCFVKDQFFEPEEAVMQVHPPRSDYVNYYPTCLHLWRPHNKRIPLPPSWMVGPKQ